MIRRSHVFLPLIVSCLLAATSATAQEITVTKIWDAAPHNAFTDIVRFKDRLYCTFREGSGHVHGENGAIRVIVSEDDGETWRSVALLEEDGVDLRDPKISTTPDGRLMLTIGGSFYENRTIVKREPRVAFSDFNGDAFGEPLPVEIDAAIRSKSDWLWRVTWHENVAWGVVYRTDRPGGQTDVHLVRSADGIRYEHVTPLIVPGRPNETTLRFMPDHTLLALVRREGGDRNGRLGVSAPPYSNWTWHQLDRRVGGPNFIRLSTGDLIAGTREYREEGNRTVLGRLALDGAFERLIELPSGGDTSYPGLLEHEGTLYVSYYASHEGKTSIYLARIPIVEITKPRDDDDELQEAAKFDGELRRRSPRSVTSARR